MKRPLNRYQNALKNFIKDVEFVTCPYCGKKSQFLHWRHLKKLHDKTIEDVRKEFPHSPTMTKRESEKRSMSRIKCNSKVVTTSKKRYGGIGFSSENLAKKTRDVIKKRYGNRNIMKTTHGKKFFEDELNPMKDLEIAKKVSKKMKGRPSQLKGKTYEEILGSEKTKRRRKELKKSGAYGQSTTPKISAPQLELFKMVKEKYPTAVLEYPVLDYCLDIAVPELKLCFEYDGSYWHDPEKDKKRDEILEEIGWKVTRYVDDLPDIIF